MFAEQFYFIDLRLYIQQQIKKNVLLVSVSGLYDKNTKKGNLLGSLNIGRKRRRK